MEEYIKTEKKYKEGEGANGGDATTKGIIEENFSGLKKDWKNQLSSGPEC